MEIPIEIEQQLNSISRIIQEKVEFQGGQIFPGPADSPFRLALVNILNCESAPWNQRLGMRIKEDAILCVEAVFPNLGIEQVPPEFWLTPVGKALLQAILWADQDELLTLTQAAAISGRSLSHLSNYARGRLPHFYEPSDNPTHSIRLRKSDVLALPVKRVKTLD